MLVTLMDEVIGSVFGMNAGRKIAGDERQGVEWGEGFVMATLRTTFLKLVTTPVVVLVRAKWTEGTGGKVWVDAIVDGEDGVVAARAWTRLRTETAAGKM